MYDYAKHTLAVEAGEKSAKHNATAVQRRPARLPVASFDERSGDVDCDGLNVLDATRIQRRPAGYADPYRIGEVVILGA